MKTHVDYFFVYGKPSGFAMCNVFLLDNMHYLNCHIPRK